MKYLIDIPTIKDAAGVEYEPTGEWRVPKKGEWYLYGSNVASFQVATHPFVPYIILRPLWTWPSWLGGWGFAMDESGTVRFFLTKAEIIGHGWGNKDRWYYVKEVCLWCPTFTPPVITDWTVPVVNPNWKGAE